MPDTNPNRSPTPSLGRLIDEVGELAHAALAPLQLVLIRVRVKA